MYTVCWTKNGENRWEQCESRLEVYALIIRNGLENDAKTLIFTPDAEENLLTVEDIFTTT